MFITIAILICFIVMAVLMMKNIIPTIAALPILAVVIALISGVPFTGDEGIMMVVIENGALKMSNAMVALMLGAWLGEMMNHTGISKTIIRTAAELGGDKPMLVTILLAIAMIAIYTTVSGLGSVIMIATIAIPIMISVGVKPLIAIVVFIFAYGTGLELNLTQWTYFSSVTGVAMEEVKPFIWCMFGMSCLATLIFIVLSLRKTGAKFSWENDSPNQPDEDPNFVKPPMVALLTPIIPIILIMGFSFQILTALWCAMLFCFFSVWLLKPNRKQNFKKMMGNVTKAAIDGVNDSAIGVIVMVGIGMLAASLTHPIVSESITGTISKILPGTPITYIVFFAILAPLALYRGPMNIWGLGGGLATLIVSMNVLPAQAVMCAFTSCERVQVLSDPTNTYGVWLANYVGTDTLQILKKTLPYAWILAILGVIVSSVLWF